MKKWRRFLSMFLVCFVCFSAIQVHAERELPEVSDSDSEEVVSADSVSARLERANVLGLEKWVNEEGYLLEAFYENKSDEQLEKMGVHALIHSITEEELDCYVRRLNAGIAAYKITRYEKIQEGYDITGVFEVDGVLAFCIQHNVVTPPLGSPTSAPIENVNDNLRKVLYYGYNGPASKGYSYVQTAMAASAANGVPSGNTGKRVLAEISAFPSPPKNFKVWVVHTNDGKSQDLAFYTQVKNGYAKVKKSSGNTKFTDGNNCYSLEGAVYGIYFDQACTKQAAFVTTDKAGNSKTAELLPGTYYAKEVTAPKGFALSKEVKKVQVMSNQTTVFSMSEVPQSNPMDILLEKSDAETKEKEAQGTATLADAHFAVKFYKGDYGVEEDPALKGKIPERKWIFRTDENGVIRFAEEYKISGDTFWTDKKGTPVLPLGTVTIQEIKAPEGYQINPEIFVRKITGEGNKETVRTYQKVLVEENILKLNLIKRQERTDIVIPGAEFEHTKPDGRKEILKTDENGELTLKGLQHGMHQIREISVMDGYVVNKNILAFTVSETNEITLHSTIEESFGKIKFDVEGGNIVIEMEDLLSPFSLVIQKENEKKMKLAGAEFALYLDKECTEEVNRNLTDEKGSLRFENLEVGKKYYLKETIAPKGYKLPTDLFGNPTIYEVYTESVPVEDRFLFYVNGTMYESDGNNMFFITGNKENKEANMIIINKTGFKLPETGSVWMIPVLLAGGILCSLSLVIQKRRKGYEK